MIETIKNKLSSLIKEKEVSLAMLYDSDGNILWHMGRNIVGRTIDEGQGFCKTYLIDSLKNKNWLYKRDVIVSPIEENDLSKSAKDLMVKSVVIQPIDEDIFLYIDSGIKKIFSRIELEIFKTYGELLKESIRTLKMKEDDIGGITGDSELINKIKNQLVKYSIEENPILITGETGTGKNHITELIHRYSGRKGKLKIIEAPCIPENLFESELFGHKKGAFTDAKTEKKGLIEEAENGTLLIDEITEIPISMQAKLLRFIETKRYLKLGETSEREADVRIIAATNKDLIKAMKDKEFREDLYYRLRVLEIELPPLRERKEDIKKLVSEKKFYLKGKEIGDGFWDVMLSYNWPGNVRELFSVLIKAGIDCENPITGQELIKIMSKEGQKRFKENEKNIVENIWNELKNGKSFWDAVKKPYLDRDLNRSQVKMIVERGLIETGNKYVNLTKLFNIPKKQYDKFLKFLIRNRLK